MNYTGKQSKQSIEPTQNVAQTPTVSAFADQRASTAVQFKQQQIMRAAHSPNVIQQITAEEEPIQGEFENEAPTQLQEAPAAKPNNTGLPDNLKSGIENLSGYSMDDVKVHFNSDKPAQLNAHAYAQGTDIHVAPGQEQHLPHEAWHVVQQKQGRVQATMQMKAGVPVNDDKGLENEADVMGAKSFLPTVDRSDSSTIGKNSFISNDIAQRQVRNVNWHTNNNVPVPGQQVIDNFPNITDINCNLPQLTLAVQNTFNWFGTADMPTQVVATTKNGTPNGRGNGTSHTTKIGQIGRDEYLLKRGVDQSEAFEGGHLFGKSLWDANDADVGHMNRYENLVPMSRGLNIYSYAGDIENQMKDNKWRRWTVTPTKTPYQIPEKHLATLLNLPLTHGHDGDNLLTFNQPWISHDVQASRGGVVTVANENPLLAPFTQADDGPSLVQLLQQVGAWNFLTEALQNDVQNL